jgi:aquaporin Z
MRLAIVDRADAALAAPTTDLGLRTALRRHWPEYVMEAAELAAFMISACLFAVLLDHPGSALSGLVPHPAVRRVLTGLAMGATAIAIIYSPWGKQSGAHFNPAVTLTFWRLGRITRWDAAFYILAQFAGALVGVLTAAAVLGARIAHPAVNYVATLPGAWGTLPAFLAELAMSFGLMSVVLIASDTPRLARLTGVFCGMLVAIYIALEAPISGMSMNPARSFAPALAARLWGELWVYLIAPPLGMLLAAEVSMRLRGARSAGCAKLQHQNSRRCIFCEP